VERENSERGSDDLGLKKLLMRMRDMRSLFMRSCDTKIFKSKLYVKNIQKMQTSCELLF